MIMPSSSCMLMHHVRLRLRWRYNWIDGCRTLMEMRKVLPRTNNLFLRHGKWLRRWFFLSLLFRDRFLSVPEWSILSPIVIITSIFGQMLLRALMMLFTWVFSMYIFPTVRPWRMASLPWCGRLDNMPNVSITIGLTPDIALSKVSEETRRSSEIYKTLMFL